MNTVVTAVLALLNALLPLVSSSQTVQQIVNALVQLIPVLVQEFNDMVPVVKNIIAALSDNPATTDEQLATLAALDAQCDAAFEAAATAAQAEDAADSDAPAN